jgi:pseudouridine-5'-phosphate glycosidase
MISDSLLDIHPKVKQALLEKKPVVALESTIISHGMPYPKNVETALAVEEKVRSKGAVPATIALIDGVCKVGLSHDEIEIFGKANDVWKVSIRDMAYVLSQKIKGATTVAATMRIAKMAGINFFVTGGIGFDSASRSDLIATEDSMIAFPSFCLMIVFRLRVLIL